MQDNRCPNCENDLSDAVMGAIVARIRAGGNGPEPVACPHCGEALEVAVTINATVTRQQTSASY